MESSQPKQGTNRNLIIGIIVAVILCCCCVATGIAVYLVTRHILRHKPAQEAIQDLEIPTLPYDPSNPESTGDAHTGIRDGGAGTAGGWITDEITRTTAWTSLLLMGPILECAAPTVDGTTIEVCRNRMRVASGWRTGTACGEVRVNPFSITFTPEGGVTDVRIEPPQ